MKQSSARQTAAMKARIRRLRAQYRRRTIIIGVILFILGVVAGIFAYRWYDGRNPDAAPAMVDIGAEPTPRAEDAVTPEPEIFPEGDPVDEADVLPEADEEEIFPEGDALNEADIFPELDGDEIFPEGDAVDAPEAEPEATPVPDLASDAVEEFDPSQGEVPEEYLTVQDENGEAELSADAGIEAPAEAGNAEEAPAEAEAPAAETPAESDATAQVEAPAESDATAQSEASAEAEATPEPEPAAPAGPQVIAIVPYGESFTYSTQIKADGSARVEATDEPYETVSFTQTMQSYMLPTDFATKYSTQYKLQGNEAGAGFELILNDYTGEATIIPQNVVDVSFRSESGNTVERGYQLMDAEIAGNYGVALTTNTPKVLYKRYQYSNAGEEMTYLVVTIYNDGAAQMILFRLESDEPEPTPEPVYATLQKGIKSDDVAAMQARLIELGYLKGVADGDFGQMTENAIKAAQEAFGMEVNGIADNAFQQKLYDGAAPDRGSIKTYATLQNGSTGESVVSLQRRLSELGYYGGKADGGFGAITEAAVKKAQEAFGMEANGVADDAFQQRLFAGEAE